MIAHIFISGFVQGVGFRQFTKRNAIKLSLTGWVRNLPASPQGGPDNRVEAVFQGSKEKIDPMIKICRKGPFLSEVKDVDVVWEEKSKEAYEDFEILH